MKETPEEKLLRIIESSRPDLKPLAPESALKSESNGSRGAFKAASTLKTKALVAVVVCLGAFAAFILILNSQRKTEKPNTTVAFVEPQEKINPALVTKEESASVVPEPKEKELPVKEEAPVLEKKAEIQMPLLEDLIKNFRIVGIIWSNAPQVMIEDVSDRRTYLLSQGNMLKGVLVKEILKDRVVLSYDNQETELR